MFKLVFAHRFRAISIINYLTMGWLSLVVIYQLVQRLPAGGVIYSLEVIFYVWERISFKHAI